MLFSLPRIVHISRRFCVRGLLVALLGVALLGAGQNATASGKHDKAQAAGEDPEVKLGRQNAEENDKHVKLVTDAALVERVNRIGQELGAVADKERITALWGSSELKPFNYTFKIVDDKDVNAYSLPGGYIYVNKGLLDYVHSDDELAGVLAHEITHAAHHHVLTLIRQQQKMGPILLSVLAAMLIMGHGGAGDIGTALTGAQLYMTAKLNSYGVDAEKDADHGGIVLLTHTHYNPVGLYNFMLRLASDERNHTYGDLGIYRTHPPGNQRAEAAKDFLIANNIAIDRAAVDPTLRVIVTMIKSPSGQDIAELKCRGVVLCRLVADGDLTAEERGKKVAKRLDSLIAGNLQPFEIRVSRDTTRVQARGFAILTDVDAGSQSQTMSAMAHDFSTAVAQINQKQQLETGLSNIVELRQQ